MYITTVLFKLILVINPPVPEVNYNQNACDAEKTEHLLKSSHCMQSNGNPFISQVFCKVQWIHGQVWNTPHIIRVVKCSIVVLRSELNMFLKWYAVIIRW